MPRSRLSVKQARVIRRELVALINESQIYPRANSHLDSVALALFARMAELHDTICMLVSKRRARDAVILARTLCEANITLYWLTNDPESDERVDRYVAFAGQVTIENMDRIKKHFKYEYTPKKSWEIDLLKQARALFQKSRSQWNPITIAKMARERDTYDPTICDKPPSMEPVYELFYFWFSLLAHPCIKAIESYLPVPSTPFKCARHVSDQSLPEMNVVFLSTCWLFSIALRISKISVFRRGDELDRIWKRLARL